LNEFSDKKFNEYEFVILVIAIDEQNQIALNAIRQALNQYKSPNNNQIKVNEVVIGEEDTADQICHQIFKDNLTPTYMIDVTEVSQISPILKNMAREMGIPTISTTYQLGSGIINWRNLDDIEKQILIHINQPGDIIPQMAKDIAVRYNYQTIVILYDQSFREFFQNITLIPLVFLFQYLSGKFRLLIKFQ